MCVHVDVVVYVFPVAVMPNPAVKQQFMSLCIMQGHVRERERERVHENGVVDVIPATGVRDSNTYIMCLGSETDPRTGFMCYGVFPPPHMHSTCCPAGHVGKEILAPVVDETDVH